MESYFLIAPSELESIINKLDLKVINSIEEVYKEKITQGFVCWASIGLFNPSVLFLAPVINEFLLKSCEIVNNLIKVVSGTESNSNYIPYQWIPHTTIAVKLSSQER